jgi:3-oxoacyl-(acyl-carrier-protein) synthase
MHPDTVSIISMASVSALGRDSSEVWSGYNNRDHALTDMGSDNRPEYVGKLQEETMQAILAVRNSNPAYKDLDDSVLYGMHAARAAVRKAGWGPDVAFGVNLGSSRGATRLFEGYYREFLETGATGTQASPTTTLGNIASWVAQDLRAKGPDLSHSITCSTALHAVMNGVAWLRAGLVEKFLAGGSEAPLTDFTIAQMRALKIYSRESGTYPCRALDLAKTNNSMVLGEGAAVACMEMGARENAVAWIEGIGYATEPLRHGASLSSNASCLQDSMKMALGDIPPGEIDILVLHAPGTLKGDRAEYQAVQKVFGAALPAMTTNKWKAGHTLGASGTLSLEMAVMMLQHQRFVGVPYIENAQQPRRFRYAMVNAVGFGANAVSIVLRSPVEK